jgi:prevent-host-death family protein
MDKIIGLKELRENTEKYIAEVKRGESFIVVRKSKPVFKLTPIDGEESGWETVVDFTKYRKGGMPVEEVLKRLKKLK